MASGSRRRITVMLPERHVRDLDELVNARHIFANRSEALESSVRSLIEYYSSADRKRWEYPELSEV